MNKTIQAWKNPAFRATLTETVENPVGMIELTGTALDQVSGGGKSCGGGSGSGKGGGGSKKGSKKGGSKKGSKRHSKKGSGKGCGC